MRFVPKSLTYRHSAFLCGRVGWRGLAGWVGGAGRAGRGCQVLGVAKSVPLQHLEAFLLNKYIHSFEVLVGVME